MASKSGDYNHLPQAVEALHKAIVEAIAQAAHDVEEEAKARAAVRTGYMRDHIYRVTHEGSDYQSGADVLPEVEKPSDDTTAYVAAGASYSIYVEMGTSRAHAQPFLLPAADAVRGHIANDVGARIKDALEHLG